MWDIYPIRVLTKLNSPCQFGKPIVTRLPPLSEHLFSKSQSDVHPRVPLSTHTSVVVPSRSRGEADLLTQFGESLD